MVDQLYFNLKKKEFRATPVQISLGNLRSEENWSHSTVKI